MKHKDHFLHLFKDIPKGQYVGRREQARQIRKFTSGKIDEYVRNVVILPTPDEQGNILRLPGKSADDHPEYDILFLQSLVWYYVIDNPRLATQQFGERQIIRYLFDTYLEAITTRDYNLIPPRFIEDLRSSKHGKDEPHPEEVRLAVDIIASFSDQQAIFMYRRLRGFSPGSVSDFTHS